MLQKTCRAKFTILLCGMASFACNPLYAKELSSYDPEFDEILSLDIDQLKVTSVSKRTQNLTDAPAAIYVVTQEEIRRAGVFSIPEALRLVPGVQVARVGSNRWAVSARGFNGTLANKLLVLIDGRSVYTPVFSGTYWDDQSTLIQDIDRIEVIRGPGASLWGANAVNGIINVITKSASETQGNMLSALGSIRGGRMEGRHGGKSGDNDYYRTYAQYTNGGASSNASGGNNHDDWYRARSGFRFDGRTKSNDNYTLQGDVYGGRQGSQLTLPTLTAPFTETLITDNDSYGGNILGRWNHSFSKNSEISVQSYVDHYTRLEASAEQHVSTGDIQFQHSMRPDDRNHFIWGGGARLYVIDIRGSFSAAFNEEFDKHYIVNAFVQNEHALIPNDLYITLGSKFEHNDFTGFEIQPSARLTWHPTDNQTVWGAISRAVRTPSSIEEDVSVAFGTPTAGAPPNVARAIGNPHQQSEELVAYEIGHRIQPTDYLSFDTALFYNDYNHIQNISNAGTPFLSPDGSSTIIPFYVNNEASAHVYGAEFASNWNISPNWRVTGSYSYILMNLRNRSTSFSLESSENLAPLNQFSVRSYLNLTNNVQWDNMIYFVDELGPSVDSYLRYDSRLSWHATPNMELSLIGRNLLGPKHTEFTGSQQVESGRGVVGQILYRF